jgi:hypothetical protein
LIAPRHPNEKHAFLRLHHLIIDQQQRIKEVDRIAIRFQRLALRIVHHTEQVRDLVASDRGHDRSNVFGIIASGSPPKGEKKI